MFIMSENVVILLRLLLAFVLSGLIGLEREIHGRAAGLKTHILVSVGSTLIMLTSIYMAETFTGITSADPSRIAAGVVTGIGFIGAGTILRSRASVVGLTTAASLWASAGVGLAVGCGFYVGAIFATALILFSLIFLGGFEKKIIRKELCKSLEIRTSSGANQLHQIRGILADYNAQIKNLEIDKLEQSDIIKLRIDLQLDSDRQSKQIVADILKIEGVEKAEWVDTKKSK